MACPTCSIGTQVPRNQAPQFVVEVCGLNVTPERLAIICVLLPLQSLGSVEHVEHRASTNLLAVHRYCSKLRMYARAVARSTNFFG